MMEEAEHGSDARLTPLTVEWMETHGAQKDGGKERMGEEVEVQVGGCAERSLRRR